MTSNQDTNIIFIDEVEYYDFLERQSEPLKEEVKFQTKVRSIPFKYTSFMQVCPEYLPIVALKEKKSQEK